MKYTRVNEIIAIFDKHFDLCDAVSTCETDIPVESLQRIAKMAYVLEESVERLVQISSSKGTTGTAVATPIYSQEKEINSVGVYASFTTTHQPRQLYLF